MVALPGAMAARNNAQTTIPAWMTVRTQCLEQASANFFFAEFLEPRHVAEVESLHGCLWRFLAL
eukprot:7342034-Alexandrium_andersonii.AAC.1